MIDDACVLAILRVRAQLFSRALATRPVSKAGARDPVDPQEIYNIGRLQAKDDRIWTEFT